MIDTSIPNMELDDVLELIKEFPVKPTRNALIITTNTTLPDLEEGIDLSQVQFDEYQFVLAVGNHVHEIVPGNKVLLNLEKLMVKVSSDEDTHETIGYLKFRPIEVKGRVYALIYDSYVDAIINE